MAISQSDFQQPTPPYAVIAFATLAVIFAGTSVWFYIKWDSSDKDLGHLQQQQDALMTARESQTKRYQDVMGEAVRTKGSPSVVTHLLNQRDQLRTRIAGKPELSNEDILKQVDAAVEAVQDRLQETNDESLSGLSLVDVVQNLKNANDNLSRTVLSLSEELENARNFVQMAQSRLDAQKQAAQEHSRQIDAEMLALRQNVKESLEQWNADLDRLSKSLDTVQESLQAEKTGAEEKIKQMQNEVGQTRDRLQILIDKVRQWRGESGIEFTGMVTKPDGRIVKLVPGQDKALIDIGQGHHLPLSLQFRVFSPDERITDKSKSKGIIQVVRIGPTLSECQIVTTSRNQTIMPGDLIVNSVYDRQNSYVFRVIGEFDVDGDGSPDTDGAAIVETLIKRWGGRVVSDLEVQTDFLVVGTEPYTPPQPDGSDQAAMALYQEMLKKKTDYMQEQSRAMSLSVPILSHKRFLFLLGMGEKSPLESMDSD